MHSFLTCLRRLNANAPASAWKRNCRAFPSIIVVVIFVIFVQVVIVG